MALEIGIREGVGCGRTGRIRYWLGGHGLEATKRARVEQGKVKRKRNGTDRTDQTNAGNPRQG